MIKTITIFGALTALFATLCCATDAEAQTGSAAPYCQPTLAFPSSANGDYITNVTIGTLNNTTMGGASTGSLTFFSNLASPSLTKGQMYSASVMVKKTDLEPNVCTIYIDFNQNNIFESSEMVFNDNSAFGVNAPTGSMNFTFTHNVSIPVTALTGTTRMRVIWSDSADYSAPFTFAAPPCFTGIYAGANSKWQYGEIEDYNVTIVAGTGGQAPTATISAPVAGGGTNTILLNGSVNANGVATTDSFQIGATTAYGITIAGTPGTVSGTTATSVTATVPNIIPCTAYHIRLKAANSNGTSYSSDFPYTLAPAVPVLSAQSPVSISNTSATFAGTVSGQNSILSAGFDYGTTAAYGQQVAATPTSIPATGTTNVQAQLTGLLPHTVYHYRLYTTDCMSAKSTSADRTFTTYSTGIANAVSSPACNIFPNPASDVLHIVPGALSGIQGYTAAVFTLQGHLVRSSDIAANGTDIDVSDLSNGTYILSITVPDGSNKMRQLLIIKK